MFNEAKNILILLQYHNHINVKEHLYDDDDADDADDGRPVGIDLRLTTYMS